MPLLHSVEGGEEQFNKQMWSEFETQNKQNAKTTIPSQFFFNKTTDSGNNMDEFQHSG